MARKSKKQIVIEKIKTIIKEWGSFNTAEVEADCSPCVNNIGRFTALAERFGDDVEVVVYNEDGNEMDSYSLEYEELTIDILNEILILADNYDADMYKTMKRCES